MHGLTSVLRGTRLLRPVVAAVLIVALFLALTPPPPVLSASFEVTTIVDNVLVEGSLRWAVKQAHDSPGADTISFDASVTGTITLGGGAIPIDDDLTITGPGAATLTVSANDLSRVFSIGNNAVVQISGLTIAHGLSADGASSMIPEDGEDGGGIIVESGSELTLTDCVLESNATGKGGTATYAGANGGNGGNGGAIASSGTLNLQGCVLHDNHTGDGGSSGTGDGGHGGNGGGIWANAPFSIASCQFYDNYAGTGGFTDGYSKHCGDGGSGGGCYLSSVAGAISDTTFSNNHAGDGRDHTGSAQHPYAGFGGNGGALLLDVGDFEIVGCLFDTNRAGQGGTITVGSGTCRDGGHGGGIAALENTFFLELRDCTLTGNMAGDGGSQQSGYFARRGGAGGGLYCLGNALIESCLVAGNKAGDGGSHPTNQGGRGGYGGGLYFHEGELAILRTTVEGNYAGNGGDGEEDEGGDGGGGGGLSCDGLLTMEACTFCGNHVGTGGEGDRENAEDGAGGGIGIFGEPEGTDSPATLVNCTITGNYGPSFHWESPGGGGLYLSLMECHLSHCTISDNTAFRGAGLTVSPSTGGPGAPEPEPGQPPEAVPTLLLKNCIVAGNNADTAPDLFDRLWDRDGVAGGVVSYGCNLIGDDEGFSPVYASGAPADIIGADPMLGALADNGGPTETMALQSGSPAIDGVAEGRCRTVDGDSVGEDQRGETRPMNGDRDGTVLCDIGAYEAPGPLKAVEAPDEEREKRPPVPARMSTCYMALGAYQALPGQAIQVSVNVCNGGEVKGSQTVVLSVNGVAEQSQTVAVSGGSCKTVVFTVAKSVPGTYDIDVNGMHGQFTVLAPRLVQASVPSQQDTGLGTEGIVAIAAVMIVLVLGLVAVFRQS